MAYKLAGIVMLLLSLGLFYVAYDQNATNAAAVSAINERMTSTDAGLNAAFAAGPVPPKFSPTMPASAKYALVFGIILMISGAACVVTGVRADRMQQ